MISRLHGELVHVDDGVAELRAGDVVYEVLVPAADEERLRGQIGATIEFHTLHYLESQGQGTSFRPRLVGFRSPLERDFFELFTTVKGIGNRKALRALQMPFGMVAEIIARRDVAMLTTLPEIGRKTAETIVVELKSKVDRFTVLGRGEGDVRGDGGSSSARAPADAVPPSRTRGERRAVDREGVDGVTSDRASSTGSSSTPRASFRSAAPPRTAAGATAVSSTGAGSPLIDAIEILVQLGESRLTARQLVERALDREPELREADRIVAAALRSR